MEKKNALTEQNMEQVTGGFVPKTEPVMNKPEAEKDDPPETKTGMIGGADGPTAIF